MSGVVKSGNEIENLVLKAARGGGMPLGHAEDLAAAARYLDLAGMRQCPHEGGAAMALPMALDAAHAGRVEITGDAALIAAYVAATEAALGRSVLCRQTESGAVLEGFGGPCPAPKGLGRRAVPEDLLAHLEELAARVLVPETEASRAAGAGAGLTDND